MRNFRGKINAETQNVIRCLHPAVQVRTDAASISYFVNFVPNIRFTNNTTQLAKRCTLRHKFSSVMASGIYSACQ